ncbi:MAG: LysM peptidoglycan-binding domain-containing protein [Bacillota bacterium]
MHKKTYWIAALAIAGLLLISGLEYYKEKNNWRFFSGIMPPQNEGSEKSHRQPAIMDLASLYPQYIMRMGSPKYRRVALTFDDGPDNKYTPQILNILRKHKVKATFFLLGSKALRYGAVVRRIVNEGHIIGNHGYNHLKISALTAAGIRDELRRADDAFYRISRRRSKLFRPAYSALDPASVVTIGKNGYKIILWSIDSLDWRGISEKAVLSNVLPFIKNGSVILQHSAGEPSQDMTGSVRALEKIITTLKSKGYQFVTIPQMQVNKNAGTGYQTGYHTVAAGETLYLISKQYHTTITNLQKWNPGLTATNLRIGKRIRVKAPVVPTRTITDMIYTVMPGDSFTGIAAFFGLTEPELTELNPGVKADQLFAGQSLRVRRGMETGTGKARLHLVRPDETLAAVAELYGVDWQVIASANKLADPDHICAGQILKIPD